jgi:prepilin signal peptidase PulO-like enzyme (type II secretory pathway)
MVMPVSLFVALAFAIFSWSQGQGGPIAGLVFFGILLVGIVIHTLLPTIEKLKPHLPERLQR